MSSGVRWLNGCRCYLVVDKTSSILWICGSVYIFILLTQVPFLGMNIFDVQVFHCGSCYIICPSIYLLSMNLMGFRMLCLSHSRLFIVMDQLSRMNLKDTISNHPLCVVKACDRLWNLLKHYLKHENINLKSNHYKPLYDTKYSHSSLVFTHGMTTHAPSPNKSCLLFSRWTLMVI